MTDHKRARKQSVQETKGEVDTEKNKALSKLFFFTCLRDKTGPVIANILTIMNGMVYPTYLSVTVDTHIAEITVTVFQMLALSRIAPELK